MATTRGRRMNYISEHAKQRFKERYNFELPENFIDFCLTNGIKQYSINKKGHIVNNINRSIYRVIYNDKIIEYVLSKQRNGDNVICTFNTPPLNIDDICYSYRKEIENGTTRN